MLKEGFSEKLALSYDRKRAFEVEGTSLAHFKKSRKARVAGVKAGKGSEEGACLEVGMAPVTQPVGLHQELDFVSSVPDYHGKVLLDFL